MNAAPHKFRAASNGKVFTPRERLNIINGNKNRAKSRAAGNELILLEKAKIAKDREQKARARAVRETLIANPSLKGVKERKDGSLYYQLRDKGKMGSAIAVTF